MKRVKCDKCGSEYKGNFCPNCGISNPVPMVVPKKKKNLLKIVFIVIAVIIVIGIIGGSSDDDNVVAAQASSSQSSSQAPKPESKPQKYDDISYEAELSNGNYISGVDFPEGKYDIIAISGGGNVSSDNAFAGGINAIMGTKEKNATLGVDMYEQEYSNIKLPEGVSLRVSGVTIKISSKAASGSPLKPRNQDITEEIELGNGNFVAGEDFPAGVYDIVAISGGGNVSSSNMFSGGLNEVMGTKDADMSIGGGFYQQEFKNGVFDEGVEITISGVKIKLTPSK